MKKTKKRPSLFKMLWNSFVNYFTLIKFSWVEKEAEILDKRFTPAHIKERFFYLAFHLITNRWKEHIPDRWEILVKVNDKKTFGPTLLCPFSRNDTPRWASVSKKVFEKVSKGDKVKVKCLVGSQGIIFKAKGV